MSARNIFHEVNGDFLLIQGKADLKLPQGFLMFVQHVHNIIEAWDQEGDAAEFDLLPHAVDLQRTDIGHFTAFIGKNDIHVFRGDGGTHRDRNGINPVAAHRQIQKEIRQSIIQEIAEDDITLEGPAKEIVKELEREMKKAAKEMNFELAARLRDRIKNIQTKND